MERSSRKRQLHCGCIVEPPTPSAAAAGGERTPGAYPWPSGAGGPREAALRAVNRPSMALPRVDGGPKRRKRRARVGAGTVSRCDAGSTDSGTGEDSAVARGQFVVLPWKGSNTLCLRGCRRGRRSPGGPARRRAGGLQLLPTSFLGLCTSLFLVPLWLGLLNDVRTWQRGVVGVEGCVIQGVDIGVCDSDLATDIDYRIANMPWCAGVIKYTACVPKYNPLNPSREWPDGRWLNNTISAKDSWIEAQYVDIVSSRMEIEKNKKLQKKGVDEYGNTGAPVPRFVYNDDCRDAFRNYMCWINFPRCDDDGNTLMTCRSACENMMIACEYPYDLWRCGESVYFNGHAEENNPLDNDGNPVYYRDYYPGQPFVDYDDDKKTCTPSIKGAGNALRPSLLLPLAAAAMALLLQALLPRAGSRN